MRNRSTLEILHFSLFVFWWIHGRGQVNHPGQNRLDECVVDQVDGEADTTEEVEDRRGKHFACVFRKEDAHEDSGGSQVIPVTSDIRLLACEGVHNCGHCLRPACVFERVLGKSGHEHAEYNHHGRNRRR